jgi:hypothetical protein
VQLSIRTDFAGIQRQLAALREDVGRKALASALNKTVAQAKTQMQRAIAREYAVTLGYVRGRLRIRKAFAAGRLTLSAELAATSPKGRSANIIAFVEKSVSLAQARKRANGGTLNVLRVRVKRGAYKPLPGAFIGNKGRTVFERVPGKQMQSRPGKLNKNTQAIRPVRTIDVAQMFNTRRINSVVLQTIRAKLPGIFANEARFYIDRFNAKAAAR